MQNWDLLLEQAETTLNLLRPSRLNPNLSAYAQLNGTFDYNRKSMPPQGTITLVHKKPQNRVTWEPNGQEGWYVWPNRLHYRCLTSYIPNKASERVSNKTELFPVQKKSPSLFTADTVTIAAADLTEALQNPTPSRPIPQLIEKQMTSLKQLAAIFNTVAPQSPSPTPAQIPMVETPEPPHQRGRTQKPATTVPL